MNKKKVWDGIVNSISNLRYSFVSLGNNILLLWKSKSFNKTYINGILGDMIFITSNTTLLFLYCIRRLYTVRLVMVYYIITDMLYPGLVFPDVISNLKWFMIIVMTCMLTVIFMCMDGYDFDVIYDMRDIWLRFYWRNVYFDEMLVDSTDNFVKIYKRLRFDRNFYLTAAMWGYFYWRIKHMDTIANIFFIWYDW